MNSKLQKQKRTSCWSPNTLKKEFLFLMALSCLASLAPPCFCSSAKEQALESFKAKKYSLAAEQFEKELKKNPSDESLHFYLAQSYLQSNKNDKAKAEFEWVSKNSQDKVHLAESKKSLLQISGEQQKISTKAASSKDAVQPPKAALPIVYDFGAPWCAPCKKFAPTFDKVAASYKGKAEFVHIDADDEKNKALVEKYKVSGLPTIIFVDTHGKTVFEKNAVLSETELIQQTDALIK